MHIALWIFGVGALIFGALAFWSDHRDTAGPDQALGAAVGAFFLGCIAACCTVVWIVLVIIKAASA